MSCRRCCGTTTLYGLFSWMAVIWLFAVGTYVFSWMMWLAFLNDTSDEAYCVGDIKMLHVIYIVYPVLLGLWRQVV